MTAIPQPTRSFAASDALLDPLRKVARRRWTLRAARAALHLLAVALAIVLTTSLTFGFWQTIPIALRVAIALIAWVAIAGAAVIFLRPMLRRAPLRQAAYAVENSLPDVHERISSAVEISEEPDSRFAGSTDLVQRLIAQAEQDARNIDPVAIAPAAQLKQAAMAIAPVALLWLVLLPFAPRPMLRGLVFTFMPWRVDAPAALAEIHVSPGDAKIAQGDAFAVEASVAESNNAARVVRSFSTGQTMSRDMDAVAKGKFAARFENVRESFRYRVESRVAGTVSRWFDVTVVPRPAVARLDVSYDFPDYTHLPRRTDANSAGDVRAIVGTKVRLTVHSPTPVVVGDASKSRVVVNKDRRDEQSIELAAVDGSPNAYAATLVVHNSGTYQIRLLSPETFGNGVELWNRDDQPRSIEAIFDQPPTVAIVSPKSEETVGIDEQVPVTFDARDDFGIASVDALVQVEDKPLRTVRLNFSSHRERKSVHDQWALSVPFHLAQAGITEFPPTGVRITYQLKATDNRDPDPQSALSAKQVLIVRREPRESVASRLETEQAQKLQQSIDQAVQKLDQSRPQLELAKTLAVPLGADQQKQVEQARQELAEASKALEKAAEEHLDSALAPVAKKAQKIAEEPVRQAAEQAAKAALNPKEMAARMPAAAEAQKQIDAAKQQLAQLKQDVNAQLAKLESARLLEQAREIQREVAAQQPKLAAEQKDANATAQKPDLTPAQRQEVQQQQQKLQQQQAALQQRQQEAAARAQAAAQKEPALQNAKAVEDARRLEDLAQQLAQLQVDQQPVAQQLSKQGDFNALQVRAEAMAKRQEALNEEIKQFAREEKSPVQLSSAALPTPDQMNNVAAALRQPNFQQAAQAQKQAADQLAAAAKALAASANQADAKGAEAEKAKQAAQANQQAIEQLNQQAKQAAQNLQTANAGNDAKAQEQAKQAAERAAERLERFAQESQKQADTDAKAAENAAKDAANSKVEAAFQHIGILSLEFHVDKLSRPLL